MVDFGADLDPMWGPKTDQEEPHVKKTDPKIDPNIISLRIGSLELSGVGVWPCRRKRRGSRKGRGGLKYVAENEVEFTERRGG